MMRMKFFLSFVVAGLLFCNAASASVFTGLYQAEVPVSDQGGTTRATAMSDALRQVIVKVTGNSSAADSPAVKNALASPDRYVEQYSYRSNDSGTAEPLLLGVSFDRRGIDQLLKDAGVPIWGATRPLTIVWLAVQQGGQKILVGAADRGQVRGMLERAAQRRGLPLRLPLLDATDQAKVQASDVWSDFHSTIMQASQRYEAQAVLVGQLSPLTGTRWQVRWTLYQGGTSQQWSLQGDSVEPLVAYGIDASSNALAAAYTGSGQAQAGQTDFYWVVKGVKDLRGYRRLMEYFAARRDIDNVEPEQVMGDTIRLRIDTGMGEQALQQIVALGGVLTEEAPAMQQVNSGTAAAQPSEPVYRLAP